VPDVPGVREPHDDLTAAPAHLGAPRRALATLSLTVTVSYGVLIYAFPVLLRPMEHELGLTRGQASAALSIALLVSAVMAFPAGRWLDRRGPRRLMTAGSLLAAAGLAGWATADSQWALYAVFAVLGVAMALVLYAPAFTVIAKLFWPTPRRALTILTLAGGLAGIVFTPLTQWLVEVTDWRGALLALAGVALLATAVPHALFLPGAAVRAPEPEPGEAASVTTSEAVRGPAFWCLTLALFLAYFISVALIVHLIPYLVERGFSAGFAALAAGLVGAMQIPGRALMLPLERRIPRVALTTGVFAGQGLALLLLPVADGIAVVLVFVVCFGMVRGLIPLVQATLVAEFYGPASYGAIGGAMNVFTLTAQALAPVGVGVLYDRFGGYREVVWILVAAAMVATVSGYWAERHAP
jgi:predicted MFS family arabinose efflux permease